MLRPQMSLVSVREALISAGPFIVLILGLLWLSYVILDPNPPDKVVLATGTDQGAYAEFGKRYVTELARFGIQVELRSTAGAAENRRLLRDPKSGVDVAFMQSGAGDAIYAIDEDTSGVKLVSLGNLFLEPVWIFYRTDAARRTVPGGTLDTVQQLVPLSLNIGAQGSGAANLMDKIFHANKIEPDQMNLHRLGPTPAVVALLSGELDAITFVSSPESPLVRMLLQTPGIQLLSFPQADAYARRFEFLRSVTMPRGTVDLAKDIPPTDIRGIAATASMVTTERLHPALVQLFVQAAQRIHGESTWFGPAGEFPNGKATEFPLDKEAVRYYRDGPPVLQRYLPFWVANLIDRMWVVLASIIVILIPLSRIVPPLYEFRIRSRVFRWYRQLREIEEAANRTDAKPAELLPKLDELEHRVEKVSVPLSYADELYSLRGHIDLIRKRLQADPV
ncbi:MAG: C4-dicarboxylate ABC transporter substrate-binding protein [Burkholderiaceae bacterium]|nr:C4-dicarboxylate ABC transporter substrate-binding protein [Burkholderiaceae bacterium]